MSEIGGSDLDDVVRRVMKFMLSDDLARLYNFTGQRGKNKFGSLDLFQGLFGMYLWFAFSEMITFLAC